MDDETTVTDRLVGAARNKILGWIALGLLVALGFVAYALSGGSQHVTWVYGVTLVVVGAATSRAGFPLRVLSIVPIWFVGIVVIGYGAYQVWGGWGLAGGVALAIGGAVLAVAGLVVGDDRRYLASTPSRLERARARAERGDAAGAWSELRDTFRTPAGPGAACHMARRALATAVEVHGPLGLSADQVLLLRRVDEILAGPLDGVGELDEAAFRETEELFETRGALPPSGRVLAHLRQG